MEGEVLTRSELAKLLKVTDRTIDNLRKEGMPFFRVGVNIRFNKVKVLDWLEQRSQRKSSEEVA
jgi:excisionase family DNA binding protein